MLSVIIVMAWFLEGSLHRDDLPDTLLMVQLYRSVRITLPKPMTQDVHTAFPCLPMKHCQHEAIIPLWPKVPVLPSREVISPKQIHKVPELPLWDAEVFASMASQPVQVPAHMLLGPDHVTGVVIEEEVYQLALWIRLRAQKHKLAVLAALAGSQPDLPPYRANDGCSNVN